jgi:hypothetical protein
MDIVSHGGQSGQVVFVFERQSDGLNLFRATVRQVGDRSVFDLSVLSVAISQKVSGIFACFASIDVHSVYTISRLNGLIQEKNVLKCKKSKYFSGYIYGAEIARNVFS